MFIKLLYLITSPQNWWAAVSEVLPQGRSLHLSNHLRRIMNPVLFALPGNHSDQMVTMSDMVEHISERKIVDKHTRISLGFLVCRDLLGANERKCGSLLTFLKQKRNSLLDCLWKKSKVSLNVTELYIYVQTYTRTCIRVHTIHVWSCAHVHTHTHIHAHYTRTYLHTHTHIHTCMNIYIDWLT